MRKKRHSLKHRSSCAGFTMTEVMIAVAISVVFFTMAIGFFISTFKYWGIVDQRMSAEQEANLILGRMIYGSNNLRGLRAANGYKVKTQSSGWTLTYGVGGGEMSGNTNTIVYNKNAGTLVLNPGSHTIGRNVADSSVKIEDEGNAITVAVEVETQLGAAKFRQDQFHPLRRTAETTVVKRNSLHSGDY